MKPINLNWKLSQFNELWTPKIVGALNEQHVKLAKVKGEMVWHSHADEDELFLVIKENLEIQLRDGNVTLTEGEMYIVSKGIEHKPVAEKECHIRLFEPASTKHTGDVQSEMTVNDQEWI